jgi:hypothetical protein
VFPETREIIQDMIEKFEEFSSVPNTIKFINPSPQSPNPPFRQF